MNLKQSLIRTFPGTYEAVTVITGLTPKNRAQGVDVYGKYQGHFRPETATQRIDFAVQKLTEGITIKDPHMNEIWSGVKQIGMRGAYHYQRSGVSWKAQADYFLEYASKYDHHFIADDLEKINNQMSDSYFADAYRILHYWKEQMPSKRVVLYSNWDVLKTYMYPSIQRLYGASGVKWMIDEIDIWYAQYWNTPSVDKDPSLVTWMKTWRMWQITDNALKPLMGSDWGMGSKDGDVDVFNGTSEQMRAWLGITSAPPVEPDPPPIVVVPPARPTVIPETALWSATVRPVSKMIVRTYPLVAYDTRTPDYVYGGEVFKGRLWSGNNFVWIRIDEYPSRPVLIGKWVAVRSTDGTSNFIMLRALSGGAVVPPAVAVPKLWWVLHDAQLGTVRQPTEGQGAPEVFPMMDKHFTPLTSEWQEFTFELMALPANKWRAVFSHERAITNDNGYERPGDPRADYINKRDQNSPPPKYASLLFGGNVITGRVDGLYLWVETLDGTKPPPSVAWVRERPWLRQIFTNVGYGTGRVTNFPQGDGLPVVGPILASRPVRFPLKGLRELLAGTPIPKVYWP